MKSFEIEGSGEVFTIFIDDADYEKVMKHKWCVRVVPHTNYVSRTIYLGRENGESKFKSQQLSRYILGLTDPTIFCDHRDGDGLNNQRDNLRVATPQENSFNKRADRTYAGKPPSSKYKGVHWHKRIEKWGAAIAINKRQKHLGYFDVEEDARDAYEARATEIQKEFKYKGKE